MQVSEQWLREWVNPSVSTSDLVAQLTMAGLEVDAVQPAAGAFNNVVVGEILTAEQHPNAEKLRVCTVNSGTETLQIVCGAANARPGIRIPLAKIGATLPNGMEIKQAKLRGVESFGMLCSAEELGLAESSDGLLELPADAPIGQCIRQYMKLDDQSILVDLTPNRSDCLSVKGLAREIGVLNRTTVSPVSISAVPAKIADTFPVELVATDACPNYLGRVIRNVKANASTPLWMAEKLRRSGVRAISPVVDVTNFILLELGQPMHAFDLNKLKGGILVRKAQAGEKLELLNGQTAELDG
ncbi:MAG TPA: phenylalanine--tRNA ligase subunit beta, partial [Pseudomonadales bacterium]|nr:phenylalanine--tRNA ligase subunit beta [Pseudomonadales bacterium]